MPGSVASGTHCITILEGSDHGVGTHRRFGLFPSYVLKYNTLHFVDRFGPHLQAQFFQNQAQQNCMYMVSLKIYMTMECVVFANYKLISILITV
jgi:hypothetical protein